MPVLRSISASQSSCRLLCHSNIRSCSLMCLALSQHHAALVLSCALLCLSITLHLLYHAALILMCLSFTSAVLLSQVLCFVSASLTPFLLSLMCLICLVTVLVHVHCFVSTSRRSYVVSGYHAALALYVPCFVRLSITMLSQVLRLSITPLMCLALGSFHIKSPDLVGDRYRIWWNLVYMLGNKRWWLTMNISADCWEAFKLWSII